MRPKPLVLTATVTEQSEQFGPALKVAMFKNIGANDVYIDFDNAIDTNTAYVLEAGETLTIEYDFVRLFYKATSGTSRIHVIKIIQ